MKTKIFSVILILFSFTVTAQNWKTINSNDTTYFTIDAPTGPDSLWHGFLRCVWVDSSNINGADSIFYFNRTIRDTSHYYCIDTMAPSFLGDHFVRSNATGVEYYTNDVGGIIEIRSFAMLNDSWKLVTDTSGIDFYGTVSAVYTMPIDGIQDSVKEISIQASLAGNPINHSFNNKKFILSKNHGFYMTNQLYLFPHIFGAEPLNISNLRPYVALNHVRVEAQIKNLDLNIIDLQAKYKPGNEWIIKRASGYGPYDPPDYNSSFYGNFYTTHDSIISVNFINVNTVAYTYQRKEFHFYINQITSSSDDTTLILTDTVTQNNSVVKLNSKMGVDIKDFSWANNTVMKYEYYFLNNICNYPYLRNYSTNVTNLKIDTCIVWNHSISGYTNSDVVEAGILNFKLLRFGSFDYGQVLMSNGYMELLYLKTDSCTYLNKINVLALASQDLQKKSDNITLYPNPVQELLNVSVKNPDTKIEKISIINLAGQTITDFYSNETKYNLNNIKAGLYIIEISTNKGKFRQKITKF